MMRFFQRVLQLFFLVIGLIFVPEFSFGAEISDTQSCVANGRVAGICKNIRGCSAALGYLRANVTLPSCTVLNPEVDTTYVCCPVERRISETKCEKFQNVLRKTSSITALLPLPFLTEEVQTDVMCDLNLNALISGGRDAKIDEMPFMVALGYGSSNNDTDIHWRCGGTLISEEFVLTAAHCVINRNVGPPTKLLLGDVTLSPSTSKTREIIGVSKAIVHPLYKAPLTYHDIALIQMARKVNITKSIRPACLPQAELDLLKNIDSKNFTASGFGITGAGEAQSDILQVVNLSGYNYKVCNSFYQEISTANIKFPNGISRSQICAGDNVGRKDTCQGDSGGPLLLPNKEKRCIFYVTGTTSFGPNQCGGRAPAVYTNVLSYLDWIEDEVWPEH